MSLCYNDDKEMLLMTGEQMKPLPLGFSDFKQIINVSIKITHRKAKL
jgi:hypothetical protein